MNKQDSIWTKFECNENLLISFGGIKQGMGLPVFEFQKTLQGYEVDKIFIRDFHQAWYQIGVNSSLCSIEEIRNYLAIIIQERKYKHVTIIGNSMGGFAAILFGALLNVDRVIAFSPQTFVDRWYRIKYLDFRWRRQIGNIYKYSKKNNLRLNLKKELKQINYNTQISIYYGLDHRLDRIHALQLEKVKNVRLCAIEEGGHRVVKVLRDQGKLANIIFK